MISQYFENFCEVFRNVSISKYFENFCEIFWYFCISKIFPEIFAYINLLMQGEECGTLVKCKLCKTSEPRNRIYNLESISEELWFCDLEHLYAYKASTDVLY